ncbi:hypothetical protein EGX98_02435 [Fusobacterium necrophorum]|nr:hypothetical protein EGX98_02435 [Fusobacterium necrophorum]AZW10295.1 hypothetical protein EO219_04955 [Fusobacterium necrophorum subsp. necrophorum]
MFFSVFFLLGLNYLICNSPFFIFGIKKFL